MRKTLAVAAVLALALSADAKRGRREPVNTPTGVRSLDGRIVPWGSGFAVLRKGTDGPEIAAFDAEGKNPKVLAAMIAPPRAWCASPKETRVAWILGNALKSTDAASGKTADLGPIDGFMLAISKDDKTVACLADRKLVLLGEKRREIEIDRARRFDSLAFTGDGKWLMVMTGKRVTDVDAPPDQIERVDLSADAPKLEVVYAPKDRSVNFASASPKGDSVAFVEGPWGIDPAKKVVPTLHVIALGSGKLHDIDEEGNFRDLAWSADGSTILMVVDEPNRASQVVTQELSRSGTMQVYWRDDVSVRGELDASAPASGPGGTWFLRGKAGEPREVVKAEAK